VPFVDGCRVGKEEPGPPHVLITSSSRFRRFVFTALSCRVTDLFRIIEEVAFQRR
jgi:hypothetical protein